MVNNFAVAGVFLEGFLLTRKLCLISTIAASKPIYPSIPKMNRSVFKKTASFLMPPNWRLQITDDDGDKKC